MTYKSDAELSGSDRITHLILTDLISSELSSGGCTAKRPGSPRLRAVGQDSTNYVVLTGRSRGELGRFTAHSLPLSSDETTSVQKRTDVMGRDEMRDMNAPPRRRFTEAENVSLTSGDRRQITHTSMTFHDSDYDDAS